MRSWISALFIVPWLSFSPQASAQTPTPDQVFADIFASVLAGENPDTGQWGAADRYLKAARGRAAPSSSAMKAILQADISQYRLLIVPGFLSECASTPLLSAAAFADARKHLNLKHGVDAAIKQVHDASCEDNGLAIANYIKSEPAGKKFIVVGHSKGAADLQLALQDPQAAARVAAIVSVAGAIHGSPLASLTGGPELLGHMRTTLGCAGQVGPALKSLLPSERTKFLASHPAPTVRSYSIVAASDYWHTSRFLQASWLLLGASVEGDEDGLLLATDGILPNAKFLGTLIGDHIAVAHDFRPTWAALIFNTDFPRDALLEALVRFVVADLGTAH